MSKTPHVHHKQIPIDEFILGWQSSKGPEEAGIKLGISGRVARSRAHMYRGRGIKLKKMNCKTPCFPVTPSVAPESPTAFSGLLMSGEDMNKPLPTTELTEATSQGPTASPQPKKSFTEFVSEVYGENKCDTAAAIAPALKFLPVPFNAPSILGTLKKLSPCSTCIRVRANNACGGCLWKGIYLPDQFQKRCVESLFHEIVELRNKYAAGNLGPMSGSVLAELNDITKRFAEVKGK